jgi:hypothetical protein
MVDRFAMNLLIRLDWNRNIRLIQSIEGCFRKIARSRRRCPTRRGTRPHRPRAGAESATQACDRPHPFKSLTFTSAPFASSSSATAARPNAVAKTSGVKLRRKPRNRCECGFVRLPVQGRACAVCTRLRELTPIRRLSTCRTREAALHATTHAPNAPEVYRGR